MVQNHYDTGAILVQDHNFVTGPAGPGPLVEAKMSDKVFFDLAQSESTVMLQKYIVCLRLILSVQVYHPATGEYEYHDMSYGRGLDNSTVIEGELVKIK